MQLAGIETLALWHEEGEWWRGELPRVIHRYLDQKGVRKEEIENLKSRIPLRNETTTARVRRVRDEKVAIACGYEDDLEWSGQIPDGDKSGVALHTLSGYAFGRGTMIAAEIPIFAGYRDYGAVLLADPFSLVGAMEFHKSCERGGLHGMIGCSFEMAEGGSLVLVARNKQGYRSLSHLVTACHLEEPRLFPLCTWERLERYAEGLLCLTGGDDGPVNRLLIRRDYEGARALMQRLSGLYGRDNVFVEIERSFLPWQIAVNRSLLHLAQEMRFTPVAGGPILYEHPVHFPAHDILVCIETLCLIDEIEGRKPRRDPSQQQPLLPPRRSLNADRYMRHAKENEELYKDRPDLLQNAWRVVERCERNVLPGRTQLPEFCKDEDRLFRDVTLIGAHRLYPKISKDLRKRINMELERITRLGFSRHFLVAWDMCNWATGQGILLSGRGSVVDSVVAYCLGMSRIDPFEFNLHFDRFLPADGQKRPDIDIDFEAKRREDVRQYLVRKYGADHVATVAAVGTFGTRGIVREVGKVMGIPEDSLKYLSKRLHGSVNANALEKALDDRPELRDSDIPRERFHWVFQLASRLMDLPRNIRSHSSGVVISKDPIADTVPLMWSGMDEVKIIQWDKRSAKRCFDKFDVLCLRGNDALGTTQRHIKKRDANFSVTNLPLDDENTYRTMRAGELIGIPQSASPAMRQAHIRIKTANLKDAGIVQASIRPGVGGAVKVNEYVARRRGKPYKLLHQDMEEILGHTMGIIVFQEQIDQLLQTFGNFTSDEAEIIRESIYKHRRIGYAESIREKVIQRVMDKGYSHEVAQEVYSLVAQFQGYGFAEGHALAFAEISVRSIWCQQNYPAEYFAAILDAQPAGYYGPCTLVNEARRRGVVILPPDVNQSLLTYRVENVQADQDPKVVLPNAGIRVSLEQIGGLSEEAKMRILISRDGEAAESDLLVAEPRKSYGSSIRDTTSADEREACSRRVIVLADSHGGPAALCRDGLKPPQQEQWRRGAGGLFSSFFDFVARVELDRDELELLILCGAFDSLHPNRRELLWGLKPAMEYGKLVRSMHGALPLGIEEPPMPTGIEDFSEAEKAIHERQILDLDVQRHLMAFERERVKAKGGVTAIEAGQLPNGEKAFVVGNPIRLRFPPTSSGKRVMFFDLEDESGLLNVTCFDDVYQRDGHVVICSQYITLWGEAQHRDDHVAFLAHRIFPYKAQLRGITPDQPIPIATADFLVS